MSWSCSACATVNALQAGECAVCGAPRPGLGPSPSEPVAPAVPVYPVEHPGASGIPVPGSMAGWPPATSSLPPGMMAAPPSSAVPQVPVAVRTAEAVPSAAETGKRPGSRMAVIAAVVALAVVAAGIGVAVALRGSNGSTTGSPTADQAGRTTGSADRTSPETEPVEADTATSTTTTTTQPQETRRSGRLDSGFAKLRAEPSPEALVLEELDDPGMELEVIGSIDDRGWVRVVAGGREGWLYGVFVAPPEPGYCLGVGQYGTPQVVDASGYPLGVRDPEVSGTKILITTDAPEGELWPVVTAWGESGFVRSADMKGPTC